MSHQKSLIFYLFLSILLDSLFILVLSAPPEGPPRSLFRPRDRFPVHLKSGANQADIRRKIEDKLTTNNNRFSSGLPPITDVTSAEEWKVKPTVRIFTIGTSTTQSVPWPSSIPNSPKSLLDDTEPMDPEDLLPSTHPPQYETESIEAESAQSGSENGDSVSGSEDKKEPEGQETIYGGIVGIVTPTVVAPPPSYTRPYPGGRPRPSVVTQFGTSLLPSTGITSQLPVGTKPPVGPSTEVPILGVGPSPSITTVHMPSPPTGSSGFRSLFSSGRSTVLGRRPLGRDQINKGVSFLPISSPVKPVDEEPNIITDFLFSDIKCYRTKQKEYFGAKIHMKSGFHVPYIRDRPDDPLTSSECQLEPTRDSSTFHMKMTDLRGCGVEQCGESMCLTMVFPRMPILALADDEVTTIKCLPQKSSMAEMKTISFAGDSLDKRRSGSTVEGGGQEFAAEVGVFRQNAGTSNGLFAKRVNSGGVVQLGEPLQLRSVVRGGDGWTFSKLTDVKVWRMRDSYSSLVSAGRTLNPGDASEVITLVDERGCRNGEFRVIADSNPLRDPRNDLVHHFTFKAFLFRGQRANEPLIVTAKVQACQERDDCDVTDCSGTRENEDGRYKRSLKDSITQTFPSNSTSMNWNSQVALRVIGLNEKLSSGDDYIDNFDDPPLQVPTPFACADKMGLSAFIGSFLTLLLSTLLFTLISFCRNGKQMGTKLQKTSPVDRRVQNRKCQRTVSANTMNSDYVRYPKSENSVNSQLVRPIPQSTNQNQPSVAKMLKDLDEHRTYSGSEHQSDGDDDDGVYVLYYKRSRSAPASLREKFQPKQSTAMTDFEDSDTDNWTNFGPPRQTVRSIKKRSQRRQKQRDRKRIPSAYIDSNNNSLSPNKQVHGSRTSIHIGSDGTEQHQPYFNESSLVTPSLSSKLTATAATHLVTRNEASTQIIIFPETNV